MSQRDTQFQGFASLLLGEMLQASKTHAYSGLIDSGSGAWLETMQQIIARRGYDLILYALAQMGDDALMVGSMEHRIGEVPDLTELPKEEHS